MSKKVQWYKGRDYFNALVEKAKKREERRQLFEKQYESGSFKRPTEDEVKAYIYGRVVPSSELEHRIIFFLGKKGKLSHAVKLKLRYFLRSRDKWRKNKNNSIN